MSSVLIRTQLSLQIRFQHTPRHRAIDYRIEWPCLTRPAESRVFHPTFRAFGGLFVLFGGGFYLARRLVSARRSSDLEDYRARHGQGTIRQPDDKSSRVIIACLGGDYTVWTLSSRHDHNAPIGVVRPNAFADFPAADVYEPISKS
ncbi:hypothetical protein DFH06DRAFT_1323244 [Mycena polygramma]|nr:hypothetical protein DFH06DRAFT_1323244 [Mycena polygramma]